jgi:cytochrome c biogenesis protein CcmG/thiol:disulfide interchange protein DsbE
MSNRPGVKPSRSTSRATVRRASASASGRRSRPAWIIGVVAVAVIGALVIAVVATTRSSSTAAASGLTPVPTGPVAFGDVQVKGTPLPTAPTSSGAADPAVGLTAPTVSGETFTGSPLSIPASGTPAVIMFVAHWCPHCNAEVPKIVDELNTAGLPSGVDLYAVATGTNEKQPNYPPGDWLNQKGWPVPTIADDQNGTAANAFGVASYPTFVVLDAQGEVVARTSGELPIETFRQLIDQARASSVGTTPAAPAGSTVSP